VRDSAATGQPLQWKTTHLLRAARFRQLTRNTHWYVVSLSLFHLCLFLTLSRRLTPLMNHWPHHDIGHQLFFFLFLLSSPFLSFILSFFSGSPLLPFFLSLSYFLILYNCTTICFFLFFHLESCYFHTMFLYFYTN
jgi:hypothetical protein